jgi:hypothetical protein
MGVSHRVEPPGWIASSTSRRRAPMRVADELVADTREEPGSRSSSRKGTASRQWSRPTPAPWTASRLTSHPACRSARLVAVTTVIVAGPMWATTVDRMSGCGEQGPHWPRDGRDAPIPADDGDPSRLQRIASSRMAIARSVRSLSTGCRSTGAPSAGACSRRAGVNESRSPTTRSHAPTADGRRGAARNRPRSRGRRGGVDDPRSTRRRDRRREHDDVFGRVAEMSSGTSLRWHYPAQVPRVDDASTPTAWSPSQPGCPELPGCRSGTSGVPNM